jgi:hypothetical protein
MRDAPIQQVERALAAYSGLVQAAVVECESLQSGRCLVAYVAPKSIDMLALYGHIRRVLPGPMVPAKVVALDTIPVTAAGAADLAALPPPELSGLRLYRPPGTDRQAALCEIFAEVLRMPRVGMNDDFFSLGGQSVDAMLLAARVNVDLGCPMSMADLFDAPTVAELERVLADMTARAQ